MGELHFLRPWWFLGLIPLLIAVISLYRLQQKSLNWRTVVDPDLMPYVLSGQMSKQKKGLSLFALMIGLLMIIALVGPVWEKLPVPVFKADNKVVIVLDLSASMDAEDIKPSRLSRARFKIRDILEYYKDVQFGLVVFTKVPYVISPITDDAATVASLLPALSTTVTPVQGSNMALAMDKAGELLKQSNAKHGQVILITDSKAGAAAFSAAKELKANNYSLAVLGVGTSQGSVVPQAGGSFIKDADGALVFAKLDKDSLMDLVRSADGAYSELSSDNADIKHLIQTSGLQNKDQQSDGDGKEFDIWIEYAPWLSPLILLLSLGLFRRGVL